MANEKQVELVEVPLKTAEKGVKLKPGHKTVLVVHGGKGKKKEEKAEEPASPATGGGRRP